MKKLTFLLSILIILSMLLISCSSESKTSESTKKSNSESTSSDFKNEVDIACRKIDSKVFSEDFAVENNDDLTDIALEFGEIEDELDGLISKFEDIEAPDKFSDDWETIIDDISHARDLFPKLAELFTQMQQISTDSSELLTNTELQQASDDLTELQREAEDISLDLSQTMEEVGSLSKKLDLGSCMTSDN